jgi:hypothetical protein
MRGLKVKANIYLYNSLIKFFLTDCFLLKRVYPSGLSLLLFNFCHSAQSD